MSALAPPPLKEQARAYWTRNPNALKHAAGLEPGSRAFLDALEAQRYGTQPCLEEIAQFAAAKGLRVLEVGCGLGVDLSRFARAGADVTAVDFSSSALSIARANLRGVGSDGEVAMGDGERLPFRGGTFDLIWSHGVIHHSPNPAAAVAEFRRVLRPGGRAIVMVYHKGSYLYRFLDPLVIAPATVVGLGVRRVLGQRTLERLFPAQLAKIVNVCAERGFRYQRIVALSTDLEYRETGVHNPLSLFFSRKEGRALFEGFTSVDAKVRQLYHFPAPDGIKRRLERRWGMFLYLVAEK